MRKNIWLQGLLNAFGVFAYVAVISLLLFNGKTIFDGEANFVTPLLMLLLFVFSAAVTGFFIIGRPIIWYLDGLKKEAIKLFLMSLGWLVGVIVILLLLLLNR
jgi:hypothetical protein